MLEGARRLSNSNVSSASLDSRVLLCHVTALSPEQLLLKQNNPIAMPKVAKFLGFIERRQSHEPIAHLVGKKEFYGIEFKVNRNVLIPRPESETVIDLAKPYLKDNISILDLGTGSGCLLLTLLSFFPKSEGVGIDISSKALQVARKNAAALHLHKRGRFIKSDWSNLKFKSQFDIIISNPPYIKSKAISGLQEDVKDYEPLIALDGGITGLDCYKEIFSIAQRLLKFDGLCIFEMGAGQFNAILRLAGNYGFKVQKSAKDLAGKIRAAIIQKS